jgi:hypothetical protein
VETPWIRLYLHEIHRADEDKHPHNHPWNYIGLVLQGGYLESTPEGTTAISRWRFYRKDRGKFHRILRLQQTPTVSLFLAYGESLPWGYLTEEGFVPKDEYRAKKRTGYWDKTPSE